MRRVARPWVIALVGALLGMTAPRASAQVLSLADLEREALKHSPTLAAHDARTRGADADIRKAASPYYPRAALSGSGSVSPGGQLIELQDDDGSTVYVQGSRKLDESGAFRSVFRSTLQLDVGAQLYDFGRTAAAVEAGKSSQRALIAERDAQRRAIVLQVRAAYLGWLNAHQIAQIAAQAAREAGQRRERVQALIDQGVRRATELSPARTDELLTRLELERAEGMLASARLELASVVGLPINDTAEPDLSLLDRSDLPAEASLDATARVLERRRDAAKAIVHMHERAQAPELSASVSAGVRLQNEVFFPMYGGGVNVTVPLWDGGASRAAAAAARARVEEIDAELEAHGRERAHEREAIELDAQSAERRLGIAQELLTECTARLATVESGFELGAMTVEQIAEARTLLRRAQTEVLMAKLARAEAHLRTAPIAAQGGPES
jgi:outer membrane protein